MEQSLPDKVLELELLEAAGIPYTLGRRHQVIHLRESGKPKVDYWISTGRWVNYSSPKPNEPFEIYGHGIKAMLGWYQQQPVKEKQPSSRQKRQKKALECFSLLSASEYSFTFYRNGYCVVSQDPGKPRVVYWPTTGRWYIAGQKKMLYTGAPVDFLAWYSKQN